MIYIFDTNSFIVAGHYFPGRFPSFWRNFDEMVLKNKILSVREVYHELDNNISKKHLSDWIYLNKKIFLIPGPEETKFVNEIFRIQHFRDLVDQKKILKGGTVADPFVIASAKIKNACVVTEEKFKENAAKIPNVCKYFKIECTNLEGFMEREKWEF
ncbi:MAG: DUF4411 family protein [Candidatus Eremiobacteraeota bacterium]|nr:DUF4411 family protein [Candidatus Eremiobacteraeota bacterium]